MKGVVLQRLFLAWVNLIGCPDTFIAAQTKNGLVSFEPDYREARIDFEMQCPGNILEIADQFKTLQREIETDVTTEATAWKIVLLQIGDWTKMNQKQSFSLIFKALKHTTDHALDI